MGVPGSGSGLASAVRQGRTIQVPADNELQLIPIVVPTAASGRWGLHPRPWVEIEANERFAHQAPELVVVLSSPTPGHKIPEWEQQLSCGAACMNLLLATHAMGFAAGWVTGWAAYSNAVLAAFGAPPERIAGFIFIGTPATALEERLRPEPDEVISTWSPA